MCHEKIDFSGSHTESTEIMFNENFESNVLLLFYDLDKIMKSINTNQNSLHDQNTKNKHFASENLKPKIVLYG